MRAIKLVMSLMVMLLGMVWYATPAQALSDSCFLPYGYCSGVLSPGDSLYIYTEDIHAPEILEVTPIDQSATLVQINDQDLSNKKIDLYAPTIIHTGGATEWEIFDDKGDVYYETRNDRW
ncbi:hypothetical protein [Moorena producens]|uniref:hypothetical protein n=1 Tax=Moorena producens TaxID=1155739 RepID=UPI003C71C1A0